MIQTLPNAYSHIVRLDGDFLAHSTGMLMMETFARHFDLPEPINFSDSAVRAHVVRISKGFQILNSIYCTRYFKGTWWGIPIAGVTLYSTYFSFPSLKRPIQGLDIVAKIINSIAMGIWAKEILPRFPRVAQAVVTVAMLILAGHNVYRDYQDEFASIPRSR